MLEGSWICGVTFVLIRNINSLNGLKCRHRVGGDPTIYQCIWTYTKCRVQNRNGPILTKSGKGLPPHISAVLSKCFEAIC